MRVLIAYASVHGSTAEIAQYIGRTLEEKGLKVQIEDVKAIKALGHYDAFVLGSPIHGGAWLPEMTSFIKDQAEKLAQAPVYLWVTCIRVLEAYGMDHVLEHYMHHDLLRSIGARAPVAFAGKLDLNAVDWNERWTLAARYDGSTWPSHFDGDFRDWDKIREWTVQVAAELQAAEHTAK
jgi:menaquinone-dependent protoporphyrinogen oxidase